MQIRGEKDRILVTEKYLMLYDGRDKALAGYFVVNVPPADQVLQWYNSSLLLNTSLNSSEVYENSHGNVGLMLDEKDFPC